jgi:hypothetical protein
MSKLKPGDAVMTEDGQVGKVYGIDGAIVGVSLTGSVFLRQFQREELTRLVPDTGLEEQRHGMDEQMTDAEYLSATVDKIAASMPMASTQEHAHIERLRKIADSLRLEPQPGAVTRENLKRDLVSVINRHSAENGSNTHDFVLAQFLATCLSAFDEAVNERARLRGEEEA